MTTPANITPAVTVRRAVMNMLRAKTPATIDRHAATIAAALAADKITVDKVHAALVTIDPDDTPSMNAWHIARALDYIDLDDMCRAADTLARCTPQQESMEQPASYADRTAAEFADLAEHAAQDVRDAADLADADAADNRAHLAADAAEDNAQRVDATLAAQESADRARKAAEDARAALAERYASDTTAPAVAATSDYAAQLVRDAVNKCATDPAAALAAFETALQQAQDAAHAADLAHRAAGWEKVAAIHPDSVIAQQTAQDLAALAAEAQNAITSKCADTPADAVETGEQTMTASKPATVADSAPAPALHIDPATPAGEEANTMTPATVTPAPVATANPWDAAAHIARDLEAAQAQTFDRDGQRDAMKAASAARAALAEYESAPRSIYAGKTPTTLRTVATYTQGRRSADAAPVMDSGLYQLPARFMLPVSLVCAILDSGSAAVALGYDLADASRQFAPALIAAFDRAEQEARDHANDRDWLRWAYRQLGPDYINRRESKDGAITYAVPSVDAVRFVQTIIDPAVRRDVHPRAVLGFVYDRSAQAKAQTHRADVRSYEVVASGDDSNDKARDAWSRTRAGRRAYKAARHNVGKLLAAAQESAATVRDLMTAQDATPADRAAALADARAALAAAQESANKCAAQFGTLAEDAPTLAQVAALLDAAESAAALAA